MQRPEHAGDKISIDFLTDSAHKIRIPICIFADGFCDPFRIHPGVMVRFILIQHSFDTGF